MFEFYWPWMALLVFLPLLARNYWLKPQTSQLDQEIGQRITLLHPHLEQLSQSFKTQRPKRTLANLLYPWLLWTLWLALVVALMRPQWLTPHIEVQSPGYDLMLAIDWSHSMEALDFTKQGGTQVTRMQVVKGVVSRFIAGRKGDRVGLLIFGSQAFVLSPLTLDLKAVSELIDGLEPNLAGGGTALGDAIALGTKKLRERPAGSRVMILIADGDNTHGAFQPLDAAKLAATAKVRIYVIGVGSNEKNIPINENNKLVYRDDLTMDENTLKRIVSLTNGAYFRATDEDALEKIYAHINQLEKTKAQSRTAFLPTPLYRWPLSIALILLLVLGIFPEARKRYLLRQPSRA